MHPNYQKPAPRDGQDEDRMKLLIDLPVVEATRGILPLPAARLRRRSSASTRKRHAHGLVRGDGGILNPAGMVQGGMLGHAGRHPRPSGVAAVSANAVAPVLEMKVSYLRPGPVGTISAKGRIRCAATRNPGVPGGPAL